MSTTVEAELLVKIFVEFAQMGVRWGTGSQTELLLNWARNCFFLSEGSLGQPVVRVCGFHCLFRLLGLRLASWIQLFACPPQSVVVALFAIAFLEIPFFQQFLLIEDS